MTINADTIEPTDLSVVSEGDYEKLYVTQREQNALLQKQLESARAARPGAPASFKPVNTASRVRAQVGELAFLNMNWTERLLAVDCDPTISHEFLLKVWGKGSDGTIGRDLQRSDPARYGRLREAAKITGAFCS